MKKKIIKLLAVFFVFVFAMSAFGCGEEVVDAERPNLEATEFVLPNPSKPEYGVVVEKSDFILSSTHCQDLIDYYNESLNIANEFLYLQIDGKYVRARPNDKDIFYTWLFSENIENETLVNPTINLNFRVTDAEYNIMLQSPSCFDDKPMRTDYRACVYSYPVSDVNGEISFEHFKSNSEESEYDYLMRVYCGNEKSMDFYYTFAKGAFMPLEYFENFVKDNLVILTKDKGENL